jgi:hypothetical protein
MQRQQGQRCHSLVIMLITVSWQLEEAAVLFADPDRQIQDGDLVLADAGAEYDRCCLGCCLGCLAWHSFGSSLAVGLDA